MFILGISAFYHDSAACILQNDKIVAAAQEERFTRKKNDADFPENAIRYCLQEAGISLNDVSYVVYYEKPFLKFERLIETYVATAPFGLTSFIKAIPLWLKQKLFQKRTIIQRLTLLDEGKPYHPAKILFSGHHQAHAASAFYPSPFNEALVISVDGVGEWATTTIWIGNRSELKLMKEIKFPHSAGLLYSAFTYYLGFKINSDEYKVMGLAPYGEAKYSELILSELIDLRSDGSYHLNMRYFDFATGLKMVNKRFCQLFGQPVRIPESEITVFHMDLAASIQQVLEKVLLNMVTHFADLYNQTNLCLAGGVALNCVINGKILRQTPVKQLWVQPAAGDAGGAIGAALAAVYQHLQLKIAKKNGVNDLMQGALLGPLFTKKQVEGFFEELGIPFNSYSDHDFIEHVVDAIEAGQVIGWFNGRMEFGPRALGSRSIIGDCRRPNMQSHLNRKIKFRESFRPFAPAILEDKVAEYYHLDQSSPYMSIVSTLKKEHQFIYGESRGGFDKLKKSYSPLPAVTHVDYTSRIQTVNQSNGLFYHLINAFYKRTGCPAIINTSFNLRDEPIVCTPADALNCFIKSNMDLLAIENVIVNKSQLINNKMNLELIGQKCIS